MAIVGFDQDPQAPPGGGLFHFDDRPSLYAVSPQHAAPFMQLSAQSDPRLAMAGGGGAGGGGGMDASAPSGFGGAPMASGAGGGLPDQQAPQPPPMASDAGMSLVDSEGPLASQSGPMSSAAGQPPAPTPARSAVRSASAAPTQVPAMGPSPGPSAKPDAGVPAALRGAPRGMQIASETKSSEGGIRALTPEEQTAKSEAFLNQALTEKRVAAESSEWEAKQALAAQQQADDARFDLEHYRDVQERVRSDYRTKRAQIQGEVDEAAKRKVDPNHFFDTHGGTLGRIVIGLASAMGAFGATLGRTPNYAQQIIDKAIDQDIGLQREQIAEQGAAAKNKMAQLMRDYDLDVGEAAGILRNSQQQLADSQARAFAHATKSKDIADTFDKWYADRAAKRVDEDIQREDATVGKVSTRVEYRRNVGGAGGTQLDKWAQGLGYPTYQALVADDAAKKRADPNHTWNDTVRQASASAKGKADAGAVAANPGLGQRLGAAVAKGEVAKDRARARGEAMGLEWDPDKDRFKVPGRASSFAKHVANAAGEFTGSEEGGRRETAAIQAADAYAIVLAGGQQPDKRHYEEAEQLMKTGSPRDFAIRANEAFDEAQAFEKAAYKHGSKTGREREEGEEE